MARAALGLLVLLALTQVAAADEIGRVRAHLRAATEALQSRDTSRLAADQRARRTRAIASLERYIERGVFPRRTGDPYPGPRPRFIDDRGVHCAVGQLLADSGAAELAREINARYEYAYVHDIREPALLAWADAHGFTVEELARIQPAYAPPLVEKRTGSSLGIAFERPGLIVACLGTAPLPPEVELLGLEHRGEVRLTATSQDEFSRCFASEVSRLPLSKTIKGRQRVWIPTLDSLMKREITASGCAPRPGALPEQATIDLGAPMRVRTKPANAEVETCLEAYLQKRFPSAPKVGMALTVAFEPRVATRAVTRALLDHGVGIVRSCYTAGQPARLTLKASARRGDPHFAIALDGASTQVAACVNTKLQRTLRALYAVPRVVGDATERYFRVDSDVAASLRFGIDGVVTSAR